MVVQGGTCLALLVWQCCLFHPASTSSAFTWFRASPLAISAQGGSIITVQGHFNISSTYVCQFDSTKPTSIGMKRSIISSPTAGGNTLLCVAPIWSHGEQVVRLSIFSATADANQGINVHGLLPGPGDTANRVKYFAVWRSHSVTEGYAYGGLSFNIEGYGFDVGDADYVCKFVCIHSTCSSELVPPFAQSSLPVSPISDKVLQCKTPAWPYSAFYGGGLTSAGTTKLTLEKGGMELVYAGASATNQQFVFKDVVSGIDTDQGLATPNSTRITVSGYGFDVSARDYSCVFAFTQSLPYIFAASSATAISSQALVCLSPHWTTAATTTQLQIYKQDCRGARYSALSELCSSNALVPSQAFLRFSFLPAVQSLSVSSGPATSLDPYSISIIGGGFTPGAQGYSCVFSPAPSASPAPHPPIEIPINGSVTGGTLELIMPSWGLEPNALLRVTIKKDGVTLTEALDENADDQGPVSQDGGLTFSFRSAWASYSDAAPRAQGSAGGGEVLTINGVGFAVNVSYGTDGDFACKFGAPGVEHALFSALATPTSPSMILCVTPRWGEKYVATKTTVSLVKGSYVFPKPPGEEDQYEFVASWDRWSSSAGPVSGGDVVAIRFDHNNGELVAYSEPVLPLSTTLISCVTPIWKSHRDSSTRMQVLVGEPQSSSSALSVSNMQEVLQMRTSNNQYLNATYQFLPGFVVSQRQLVLNAPGEVHRFTLHPDTELSGTVVRVSITSSDIAVASTTSLYTLDPSGDTESNTKEVSVTYTGAGVAFLSLSSQGAPYGYTYTNYIRVVCKASLVVTSVARSGSRGVASDGSEGIRSETVTSVVLQREEWIDLDVATSVALNASSHAANATLRLLVHLEPLPTDEVAAPIASVSPSNLSHAVRLWEAAARQVVRVTCSGAGNAMLVIQVSDVIGLESSILYTDVSSRIPLECRPGIRIAALHSAPSSLVRIQPNQELDLEISLDTPPSTRTELLVLNTAPEIVHSPQAIIIPPFDTRSRVIKIRNMQGSSGDAVLTVSASSSGMLEQFNEGCSTTEAAKCTSLFRDLPTVECSFSGFKNGVDFDDTWLQTMATISAAAGAGADCSQQKYYNCYRSACCSSADAQMCAAAVERAHCNISLLVPTLMEQPAQVDSSLDFGLPPANPAGQAALYHSWVTGINCYPHVACAWARCFPGKGNYEGVQSQSVTILASPGFRVEPSFLTLQQGVERELVIVLDRVPSSAFTVRLSVIPDLAENGLVAEVDPTSVSFETGVLRSTPVTLRWIGAGRASIRVTTELDNQQEAREYTNVTQILPHVISASPGFLYTSEEPGFEPGHFPVLYMQAESNASVSLVPEFPALNPLRFDVRDDTQLLEGLPGAISLSGSSQSALISFRSEKVGSTLLRFQSASSGSPSQASGDVSHQLFILSHGTGYTAGSLSLQGYGHNASSTHAFSASYHVGILSWEFYHDADTLLPKKGAEYQWENASTFQGPKDGHDGHTTIKVEQCMRNAVASIVQGVPVAHTGEVVAGCSPHVTFHVEHGSVSALTFDNSSCLAAGLTCSISLSGYSGAGFFGFFTTGITNVSIATFGSGFVCDWACFLTLHSTGMGAEQACPVHNATCHSSSAIIFLGNTTKIETAMKVVSVARADIVPEVKVVRQTQSIVVTVIPHQIPSGNVSFSVSADTSAVTVSNFSFFEGGECESHIPQRDCLQMNAKIFTFTYNGVGSSTAGITVIGHGVGNYNGFIGRLNLHLLPGLVVSPDRVALQHFPGSVLITFGPDTRPNRETHVKLHVLTDFGTDPAKDSYQEKIVLVPNVLVMPQGELSSQTLKITHGGVEGTRMRNRVSGKAIVTFSVDDPGNIYHGTGIIGSAKSIEVDVLPGFESNVQDTHKREIQSGTEFLLTLTLNEATVQDINVTAASSNPLAATVAVIANSSRLHVNASDHALVSSGTRGPLFVLVRHVSPGTSQVSLMVSTPGGNYGGVESRNYLNVTLMPGFVTTAAEISLQYSSKVAVFSFGLDSRPTEDVEIEITTSDTSIITVTPSLYFYASQWYEGYMQDVQVVWQSSGAARVEFVASSPGGNYNRVNCCSVSVLALSSLSVSENRLLVQRGGQVFVSVSTPTKPASLTRISISSFPPGIVSVSQPYDIFPATNNTEIVTISHMSRGSATVRISASAPGDTYDGVEYDIQVTAMPGFIFSQAVLQLYSCPRNTRCVVELEFGPEVAPTADLQVSVTLSDMSVASIVPSTFMFFAAEGQTNRTVTVSMINPGTSCLSFAATSRGNYDMVSSGGVTIISYPDFLVNDPIIYPLNGLEWGPHGLSEFDPDHPIVYVQSRSYSTVSIGPKTPPLEDTIVAIENPQPNLVHVTSQVLFRKGSLSPGQITIQHVKGSAELQFRLSIRGEGTTSNYGGALWKEAILVKVLPALEIPDHRVTVPYHGFKNITLRPNSTLVGDCTLIVTSQESNAVEIVTPAVQMNEGTDSFTIRIRHRNPGFIFLRIIAVANGGPKASNYHNSELILVLTLNYPGFDLDNRECVWGGTQGCSTEFLHLQRWKAKALSGSEATRGTARMYFTPNETPDSPTYINMDNSDETKILVQAEDKVLAAFENDNILAFRNTWYTGVASSKFFQATHIGNLGAVTVAFGSPQSDRWPEASGCLNDVSTCQASNNMESVYFGVVMPIPAIVIIAHAGFRVSETQVNVQRQNQVTVQVSLDSVPDGDTFVFLTSSDPTIATVTSQVLFLRGENNNVTFKNITIYNLRPGQVYISLKSSSSKLDYDGAEADKAIEVQCQQGFELSSLLVHVQASPTNSGQAVLSITPDLPPSHNVTMTITSSHTNGIGVINPTILFLADEIMTKNATLSHVSSGSIQTPVYLTLSLSTDPSSNYFYVVAPFVTVVPLGTFVLSSPNITVQKGRYAYLTVAPNVAPDQDVNVHVHVSNKTVVTASQSVIFLAGSLAPQTVMLTHHNLGTATLSFAGESAEGNYNGARLYDAVKVFAKQGFQVRKLIPGIAEDLPGELVLEEQIAFVVQPQPTSHLAQARFFLLSDLPADRDMVISVLSSDQSIISTFQEIDNRVSIARGTRGPVLVKVQHGGTAGKASISFRVETPGGIYGYVESGNIQVVGMPVLIFSSMRVDIQSGGVGMFTVRPGTAPSSDCTIQCISSDSAVATVTPSVVFHASDGLSSNNTKTVTLTYRKQGSVTVSFFASAGEGGNFDGLVWIDGVVAVSRPGFEISTNLLSVPYDGMVTFTIRPDTLPTESALVTVTSTQPVKAAATEMSNTFVLQASRQDTFTITIRSWCSSSPGNCARAGATIIGFEARPLPGSSGSSGNYDGVVAANTITAFVQPPRLVLEHDSAPGALLIQTELGLSHFIIRPSQPVDVDMVVSIRVPDGAACSVPTTIIIPANSGMGGLEQLNRLPVMVPVVFNRIGSTRIELFVESPGDSKFLDMDPTVLNVRALAGFHVSPSTGSLQPETSQVITIQPLIVPGADVYCMLEPSDPSVISVSPMNLIFSPPRILVGRDVPASIGLRVVLSESFQVIPRLGDGTITQTLNDNLDLVLVDWDGGPRNQTLSTGAGGMFMLAAAEDLSTLTVTLTHRGVGNASLSIRASSADEAFHGSYIVHAVRVSAEPGLVLSPSHATVQYRQRTTFELWPQTAPSSDVSVAVSVVATSPSTGTLLPNLVAKVSPSTILLFRKDGVSARNRRSVTVDCIGPAGTVKLLFQGSTQSPLPFSTEARAGNYDRMQHAAVTVKCLPGFALAPGDMPPQPLAAPASLPLSALESPRGATSVTLALLEVPTERVTVVITADDLSLVRFTSRVYFQALEQVQTRTIALSHRGGFLNGTAVLSLSAAGGNYEGAALPRALYLTVDSPALETSTKQLSVSPNGYSTFTIRLNTPPTAPTIVTVLSSNSRIVTASGPLVLSDTAPRIITVTHVNQGAARLTFAISSEPGSTYGNVTVGRAVQVAVTALGRGFRVSSRQITLAQGSSAWLSIALDSLPDSRVHLSVALLPPGIATISPASHVYEPGSTAAHFQLTWIAPGSAALDLHAKGGSYQGFTSSAQVIVTSLPLLPGAPGALSAAALHGAQLIVSVAPPAAAGPVTSTTAYKVQVSDAPSFALVSAEATITAAPPASALIAGLSRGTCYHVRAWSINSAGKSPFVATSSCVLALDAPAAVPWVRVTAMTEDKALLQWAAPTDSGDGTPLGVPVLRYVVEVYINGSTVAADRLEVIGSGATAPDKSIMLPVRAGNTYSVGLWAESAVVQPLALREDRVAFTHFAFEGLPVDYYVPFEFTLSVLSLADKVGRFSSLLISPSSAPIVDAVVRIKSERPSSADAVTNQVEHKQRGDTNLTFEIDGSNYRGLRETVVKVSTLSSDALL